MIIYYYQTKISIDFWCRQRLDPRSFIQPSKTLSVELTETLQYLNLNISGLATMTLTM